MWNIPDRRGESDGVVPWAMLGLPEMAGLTPEELAHCPDPARHGGTAEAATYHATPAPGGAVSVEAASGGAAPTASARSHGSEHEAAYRPGPRGDGTLLVDPEVHLPSPGMDVDIAWYYHSRQDYNGPYGYGRTLSAQGLCQAEAATTPTWVSLTHGTGAVISYLWQSGSAYIPTTYKVRNELELDRTAGLWRERTPEGLVLGYPYTSSGAVTSLAYVADAVDNRHTLSYGSSGNSAGRLESLQDAVGRRVSFSYNNQGLLEGIEDWAGRRTSFLYDTAQVTGKPLLTTLIGPSGCQTAYGYDAAARLTTITDPNGYATTYAYDAGGRVTHRGVAGVGLTSYRYTGSYLAVVDPLGAVTTHQLDQNSTLLGLEDATGVRTTFLPDTYGQVRLRQEASGALTTWN